MTLELCSEIIVLKAAAMLHDSEAEFAILDSALEAKSRHKYKILLKIPVILVLQYQFLSGWNESSVPFVVFK